MLRIWRDRVLDALEAERVVASPAATHLRFRLAR
jgi:hypothetical protein